MIIQTREEFLDWAARQAWLEDAFIDEITPEVSGDQGVPARVRIVLRQQVSGGIVAGEKRRMRQLVLDGRGIERFELTSDGFAAEHCCEGAELDEESDAAVAFTLDVPGEFRFACRVLEVTEREWDELVPEWLSHAEFFARARGATLPDPPRWVSTFADEGIAASWRYFDGPATDAARVSADYSGWFLQHSNRVAETSRGIFFFAAHQDGDDFTVHVRDDAEDGGILWRTCARIIGRFPDVEVHCGNAVLSGREWLEYLDGRRRSKAPESALSPDQVRPAFESELPTGNR